MQSRRGGLRPLVQSRKHDRLPDGAEHHPASGSAHMSFMKHSSSTRCFAAGTAHSRHSSLRGVTEAAARRRWGVTGPEGRDGFETMLLGRAA